jgi:hypothetical protein
LTDFYSRSGSLGYAKRVSKNFGNFEDGSAYFKTKGYQDRDSVVFIPLEYFLRYFADDPKGLAARILSAAQELVRRWKERNGKLPAAERRAVGWVDEILRYSWKNSSGKKQTTVYEVHLNTYGLTLNHQLEARPVVGVAEVKLLIKVRSTVTSEDRPDRSGVDEEGLCHVAGGYNKELFHFLGLLKSKEFASLCADTKLDWAKRKKTAEVSGVVGKLPEVSEEEEEEDDDDEEQPAATQTQ